MKVWVPGGTGMLGRAVCRWLGARQIDHVATGRDVDLAQPAQVDAFAARARPSHVINCAAFTQVDMCEASGADALAINAVGPGHLAAAATRLGARACHVSTDYVFDGTATQPYDEDAACAPLGAYGRSKYAGERAFLAAAPTGVIARTAWLYGHGGRHFARTILGLMATRPRLEVVADQHGTPSYCDDVAAALAQLLGLGDAAAAAPGVYHVVNAGATTWHGFAAALWAGARAHGRALACTEVAPVPTAAYPTPARRPAYSVLATAKLTRALGAPPRPWQHALDAYMDGWASGRA